MATGISLTRFRAIDLFLLCVSLSGCVKSQDIAFCADEFGKIFSFRANDINEVKFQISDDGKSTAYEITGYSFYPDVAHVSLESEISSDSIYIEGFLYLKLDEKESEYKSTSCKSNEPVSQIDRGQIAKITCYDSNSGATNIIEYSSATGIIGFINKSSGPPDLRYYSTDDNKIGKICPKRNWQ